MVGRGLAAPRRWRLRAAADEDPHWDDDAPAPAPEAPPPPEPFAEVKAAPPPPKPEFEDDSLASRCSAASVNFSGSYWHNSSSTREILTCFPLNWWTRSRGDDGSTRDKQEYIEIHKKEVVRKKHQPHQWQSNSHLSAASRLSIETNYDRAFDARVSCKPNDYDSPGGWVSWGLDNSRRRPNVATETKGRESEVV